MIAKKTFCIILKRAGVIYEKVFWSWILKARQNLYGQL